MLFHDIERRYPQVSAQVLENREEHLMAKYIYVPEKGVWTYALDECEDYQVLDAYLHILESPKLSGSKYLKVFEYYHLQNGGTLNDNILVQLNGGLRQLGRSSLAFVNGHTTNYAHLRGQDKILRRHQMIDHLRSLSPAARKDWIERKAAEAARLPERDADLPGRAPTTGSTITRAEVERRRAALAKAQKAEVDGDHASPSIPMPVPSSGAAISAGHMIDDQDFVPESTVQDSVVELITEMQGLRGEVAALKSMLQSIFRKV